ncbi:response regulator transcription factor [Bacillus marinisedimentorum]|uniref:response regulator transcription factor n=1 Tax=Bacillus marinisedimentorum TaxID=1821260 RepID=UPI0007E165FA|nr:LuxR C-terminal-related transcriptional regulator [Bacillus marinisedimentorum]
MENSYRMTLEGYLMHAVDTIQQNREDLLGNWRETKTSLGQTVRKQEAIQAIEGLLFDILLEKHHSIQDFEKHLKQFHFRSVYFQNSDNELFILLTWLEKTIQQVLREKETVSELDCKAVQYLFLKLNQFLFASEHQRKISPHWQDSVFLFQQWLISSSRFFDTAQRIASGLVHFTPFTRCAVFTKSPGDGLGVGLVGYKVEGISSIKEELINIPLIKNHMKRLERMEPIFIEEASLHFPGEYTEKFNLESVAVLPLYVPSQNKLIGIVILDKGPGNRFAPVAETFSALIQFGQIAGEMLYKYWGDFKLSAASKKIPLSPRELEVLHYIAEGHSINEAAEQLYLSSYTVRDYVASIIKKTEAKNRSHAISIAYQHGLIS